ncbi:MAG TPA: hypothetical protein DEH25_01240 [Chloroflexi bacterium]|nr:hypothetical protein [Chloroflexota bacterium]
MVAILVQVLVAHLLTQRALEVKIRLAHIVSPCGVGRETQRLVVAQVGLEGRNMRWGNQPAHRADQRQEEGQHDDGQPGGDTHTAGDEVDVVIGKQP